MSGLRRELTEQPANSPAVSPLETAESKLRIPSPYSGPASTRVVTPLANKRRTDSWSSLPVLVVWMIKDKLDLFDNWRLAAVCSDWRSASACYPRKLYSVGDGVPWVCHEKYGMKSSIREFVSIPRNCKREVDMPEFADSVVVFSKQGWLLLQQQINPYTADGPNPWFIVNPLTRDKIKLPEKGGETRRCTGSFTTREDGYPCCVFLTSAESEFQLTIETACPGDHVWTRHEYANLERTFFVPYTHITIGNTVYCLDKSSYVTVFNLANDAVEVLPPAPPLGIITEHHGELIYLKLVRNVATGGIMSVSPYRYNSASSLWEKLQRKAVMNTSWYVWSRQNCFSVKERGLKLYEIFPHRENRRDREPTCYHYTVNLLLSRKRTTFRVPDISHCYSCWVDIG